MTLIKGIFTWSEDKDLRVSKKSFVKDSQKLKKIC